jgi:hypothetical protein
MIRVTVQVTNLSGERYWGYEAQLPPQVQIGVNINIVGIEQKGEGAIEAPFVFTVTYSPSIAQLSVKGKAQVNGDKAEISKMVEEHRQSKPPPGPVIQAVSSIAMAEAILLSKSLGVPPPLPPMGMPSDQPQPIAKRPDSRYTS